MLLGPAGKGKTQVTASKPEEPSAAVTSEGMAMARVPIGRALTTSPAPVRERALG